MRYLTVGIFLWAAITLYVMILMLSSLQRVLFVLNGGCL